MSTALPPLPSGLSQMTGVQSSALDKHMRGLVNWFDRTIGSNSLLRFLSLLLIYSVELVAAFWIAYELRWDFQVPEVFQAQRWTLIIVVVLCKIALLHSFGQFRSVLSYFSLADFSGIILSMSATSGLMLALWYFAKAEAAPPRGVIMMDFVLSVGMVCSFRLFLRVSRTWVVEGDVRQKVFQRRVVLIGAGDVGAALAKDLLARRGTGMMPVLFIDDDPVKIGRSIHGLPVYGPISRMTDVVRDAGVTEAIVTMPSAAPKKLKEIVDACRILGLKTEIVPSFTQLASGEVKIDRTRPVAIEDLLGREQVALDSTEIDSLISGQVVVVTGAGGSIGSELCRQILSYKPQQLILVEQAEIALFEIENELIAKGFDSKIICLIADIFDEARVRELFAVYRPSVVFHAAAHKHVPLMERQPAEAVKNNTLATAGLTRLASEHGVNRFIFISTDKAINPTSVMGCSKRLAEKALVARQSAPGNRTIFMAVRFGNVLGSSGSVIPTFRRQIEKGGPVTVTHREMTRYFMTIPEAVGLVLQAATQGTGGDIFILDMGKPVKIIDLARQMIELSGYKPDVDIEIQVVGLRPGEKLYEELRHTEESHEPTRHPRVFRLKSHLTDGQDLAWLEQLRSIIQTASPNQIKLELKRHVPEYVPYEN